MAFLVVADKLLVPMAKDRHKANTRRKERQMMDKKSLVASEYERLKRLFLNSENSKTELVDELLKKAAFLKVELEGLENDIRKSGIVQVSNKGNTRISFSYKAYLQSVSIYSGIIKTLNSILGSSVDEGEDEFDDFIKNMEVR